MTFLRFLKAFSAFFVKRTTKSSCLPGLRDLENVPRATRLRLAAVPLAVSPEANRSAVAVPVSLSLKKQK